MDTAASSRALITPLRSIVIPLIVAVTSAAYGVSTFIDATARVNAVESENDEIAAALSYGRTFGALHLAHATTTASEVDAAAAQVRNETRSSTEQVLAAERSRLSDVLSGDGRPDLVLSTQSFVAQLDDPLLEPSDDGARRAQHLTRFDELAPTVTTEAGRDALTLAVRTSRISGDVVVERSAAQATLDRTQQQGPALHTQSAVTTGLAGVLPTSADDFLDQAQRIEDTFPGAREAIDFELAAVPTLRRTAEWIEQLDVSRSAAPVDRLAEVNEAALALHRRLDRVVVDHLERRIAANDADARDAWDRVWTLGLMSAIVAVGAAALTATAAARRRRKIRRLRSEFGTDPVTGLPDRHAFALIFDRLTRSGSRSGHACFHIELDGLQRVRDAHGQALGDGVLRALSRRLTTLLDEWNRDLPGADRIAHAARLDGDEFAVAVHRVDLEAISAASMSERLRASLSERVITAAGPITINISVGASTATHPSDIGDLQRRADLARYDAQRLGSNRTVVRGHRSSGVGDIDADFVLDPHVGASLTTHSAFIRELVILAERHALGVISTAQNDDIDGHLTSLGVRIVARPASPFNGPPRPTQATNDNPTSS